jgi:hypothetical protein
LKSATVSVSPRASMTTPATNGKYWLPIALHGVVGRPPSVIGANS